MRWLQCAFFSNSQFTDTWKRILLPRNHSRSRLTLVEHHSYQDKFFTPSHPKPQTLKPHKSILFVATIRAYGHHWLLYLQTSWVDWLKSQTRSDFLARAQGLIKWPVVFYGSFMSDQKVLNLLNNVCLIGLVNSNRYISLVQLKRGFVRAHSK